MKKDLQQLKEEARKEFEGKFEKRIADYCEYSQDNLFRLIYQDIKLVIGSLITKAYEAGQSEIIQIIKDIPTEFPEREDDSFDQGAKHFRDKLLKKIR